MKHRTYLHLKNNTNCTYFCVSTTIFTHTKNVSFYSSTTCGLRAFVSRDASMVYLVPLNCFTFTALRHFSVSFLSNRVTSALATLLLHFAAFLS